MHFQNVSLQQLLEISLCLGQDAAAAVLFGVYSPYDK